jgi:SPP1 gp7 family putative phage head morphogenesis protein
MDEVVEQYNQAMRGIENGTIRLVHKVLDASFNRLVRRARVHMKAGPRYADPAQRSIYLIRDFRQLVPAFRPDKVDAYDRVFRNLALDAQQQGLAIASELTARARPTLDRVDVQIPLDAVVAAAQEAKGYLRKHGEVFARTSAEVVAQGIAEGRPTDAMVSDMRERLGVVKVRANMIVRTEALRAYNKAADVYYSRNGVNQVMYYATADDRTCPWCAPRAGKIYNRVDVYVPIHPQCRCYLAPWDPELSNTDPDYIKWRQRHTDEVAKAAGDLDPRALNQAAVFETLAPTPV